MPQRWADALRPATAPPTKPRLYSVALPALVGRRSSSTMQAIARRSNHNATSNTTTLVQLYTACLPVHGHHKLPREEALRYRRSHPRAPPAIQPPVLLPPDLLQGTADCSCRSATCGPGMPRTKIQSPAVVCALLPLPTRHENSMSGRHARMVDRLQCLVCQSHRLHTTVLTRLHYCMRDTRRTATAHEDTTVKSKE